MRLYYLADGHIRSVSPSDNRKAAEVLLALHRAGVTVLWWEVYPQTSAGLKGGSDHDGS